MTHFLDDDIVDVRIDGEAKPFQLYWGDAVEALQPAGETTRRIRFTRNGVPAEGRIKGEAKLRDTPILRLSMVDVQQGDGLVLETPGGKRVLIDGGDNQLFARHVAARFRGSSAAQPLDGATWRRERDAGAGTEAASAGTESTADRIRTTGMCFMGSLALAARGRTAGRGSARRANGGCHPPCAGRVVRTYSPHAP